jgi:hypothetical protein
MVSTKKEISGELKCSHGLVKRKAYTRKAPKTGQLVKVHANCVKSPKTGAARKKRRTPSTVTVADLKADAKDLGVKIIDKKTGRAKLKAVLARDVAAARRRHAASASKSY